jgi:AhpD family alkylhydroperoxidase
MIPNLFAKMAEAPALLEGYWSLARIFENSSLGPVEQQVVLIATSRVNQCRYCVGVHSAVADMQQVPAEITDALREGRPLPDARLEALRRFTERVVEARGWAPESELEAFLAAGYTSAQVLEVVLGVGLKTLSNYTNHLAGTELDPAFAGRAWTPSPASAA